MFQVRTHGAVRSVTGLAGLRGRGDADTRGLLLVNPGPTAAGRMPPRQLLQLPKGCRLPELKRAVPH